MPAASVSPTGGEPPPNELILEGEDDQPLQAEELHDDEEDFGDASPEDRTWAIRNGWVARSAFRGSDDEWVDAKTFAERGRGVNSILKKRNAELTSQIDDIKTQFQAFAEGSNARMKRELDVRLMSASERRKQAVANGDTDAFEAAERDVAVIQKELDTLTPAKPAAPAPAVDNTASIAWYEKNTWFKADESKTRIWLAIAGEVRHQRPDLVGPSAATNFAFLDEVDRRAKVDYPERFGGNVQPRRQAATTGRPGVVAPRKTGEKTFDDLPPEGKKECDDFIRRKYLKTREDYVANYDWSAPR